MSTVFPYKGKKTRKVSRNFVSNENCCSNPPPGHPAGPLGIRDRRQVQQQRAAAALAAAAAAATTTGKMPLSQGYCLKPSLASKKRVLKVLRKENQQHVYVQDTLPCRGDSHLQCYLPHGDSKNSLNLSYLLGESFAKVGSLSKAFDVYELIASRQLDGHVPLDKLGTLASALTNHIRQMGGIASPLSSPSARTQGMMPPWLHYQQSASEGTSAGGGGAAGEGLASAMVPSPALCEDYDPLLCPLCGDILRCPVTTNCGHTFCRQCCETITQCNICQVKFPRAQDASPRGGGMPSTCALTTTTSSSAGSSFYAGFGAASTHQSQSLSLASAPMGYGLRMASQMAAAPMTVTTTTVASTTATATTTMASTSAAAAAGIISGYVSGGGSSSAMKFMPDVLVRRLVEKWWGPDLQAKEISEKASSCMHLNLLDEALKFCNASLDKAPTNLKCLCLRAEVLLKLNHYQSSLADIENALRTRCTSPKAHYLRALALSGLGRLEDALYNGFLAICLDKNKNLSNSEIFQHDLAKILQRLLAQMPKNRVAIGQVAPPVVRSYATSRPPYPLLWEQVRRRRKQLLHHHHLHHHHHHVHLDDVEDEFGHYDNYIMAGDEMEEEEEVEDPSLMEAREPSAMHLDGDFLFPSALDFMDHHRHQRQVYEQKQFDLQPRRHGNRKHCKRKWSAAMEPLGGEANQEDGVDHVDHAAAEAEESRRCSRLLASVLERTQQELQRLKKLEGSLQAQAVTAVADRLLIDASDFDCVLCGHTLWRPVVTPCGHTYCLVCLDRCMDYKTSCPLCLSPLVEFNVNASASASASNNSSANASASQSQTQTYSNLYQGSSSPVPFALAKRPVTKFLEAAMKRFIPDHYEARFRQEIDEEPSVPVFICTAAFPSVPCPLFVCEPRYRLMVRRAVESGDKTFGIVQPNSSKSRYYDVGTILDIRDCVQLSDGRSILSTIGCKRFKILARNEKDGYETAKVEYICDEPIAEEQVKTLASMQGLVLAKAIGWFESLSTEQKHEILQSYGQMPALEMNWELISDGPAWAWWIIALLPLSQQLKVDILATTSLEKRLRAIEKTLDLLHDLSHPQQEPHHHHHHHHQQAPQSPQQPHDLSGLDLDCEEQDTASAAADECCLYAEAAGTEPHTDEELLL
ncbi:uncharacterized protein LOC117894125 [Drosophila subobscura]|uniref:uncharacterized protein LOC117894125 n=1 Tax=Drosophila subobscura TaxID=7241 RepID=UPI00155A815F|nr:uncharacterized protein LOC117894125 [Drosophila subobscura]XP_034656904.1 uncharacterized protein LOC117894125 [Drosophila subobscura]